MKDTLVVAIIAAIPAICSYLASRNNARKIQQIHVDMNSRFDQWMEATKKASYAEGAKSVETKTLIE
jgi:hypothetical protein